MLSCVTYHAVVRYLERVLHLPVESWLVGMEHNTHEFQAMECCRRADLPIEAVRSAVLSPAVLRALSCGLSKINLIHDDAVYVIDGGRVVTILSIPIYDNMMRRRYGPRMEDKSKKRRKAMRRLAEVD